MPLLLTNLAAAFEAVLDIPEEEGFSVRLLPALQDGADSSQVGLRENISRMATGRQKL